MICYLSQLGTHYRLESLRLALHTTHALHCKPERERDREREREMEMALHIQTVRVPLGVNSEGYKLKYVSGIPRQIYAVPLGISPVRNGPAAAACRLVVCSWDVSGVSALKRGNGPFF